MTIRDLACGKCGGDGVHKPWCRTPPLVDARNIAATMDRVSAPPTEDAPRQPEDEPLCAERDCDDFALGGGIRFCSTHQHAEDLKATIAAQAERIKALSAQIGDALGAANAAEMERDALRERIKALEDERDTYRATAVVHHEQLVIEERRASQWKAAAKAVRRKWKEKWEGAFSHFNDDQKHIATLQKEWHAALIRASEVRHLVAELETENTALRTMIAKGKP